MPPRTCGLYNELIQRTGPHRCRWLQLLLRRYTLLTPMVRVIPRSTDVVPGVGLELPASRSLGEAFFAVLMIDKLL
jgi:hypothetical protein